MLSGKTVLIGITGGIAAYKICELIRMYKRANAEVLVVCTPNALNFVTKLTLENLSKNPVAVEEFEDKDFKPEHISYADKADIMVIAPATANTISKIATGICDNLLIDISSSSNFGGRRWRNATLIVNSLHATRSKLAAIQSFIETQYVISPPLPISANLLEVGAVYSIQFSACNFVGKLEKHSEDTPLFCLKKV